VSREEIRAVFLQVAVYAGMPAGIDGFRAAREIFEESAGYPGRAGEIRVLQMRRRGMPCPPLGFGTLCRYVSLPPDIPAPARRPGHARLAHRAPCAEVFCGSERMRLLKLVPDHTNIDFVRARFVAFALDGILVLIALISLATYGLSLGIDFTGGVLVEVKSAQTIDIGAMRTKVDGLGFAEAQLQYFGGGECETPANSCVLIRVQPQKSAGSDQAVAQKLQGALGSGFIFRRTEVVGPKVSGELLSAGVLATVIAVLMIAIYVGIRFEWQYGVGAIVATGHDVFVTAGLFSLMHLDFTLTSVAALLTLAGYSVNDTVVVFDRIRENRRRYKRMSLRDLINVSTNQTLSRTVLTSGATAISIIPLLLFGGPTLFDFTASILFGIIVGTFSSVYVASALLLYLPQVAGREEPAPVSGRRAQTG
jgi:preprotein translocase SecF subunit